MIDDSGNPEELNKGRDTTSHSIVVSTGKHVRTYVEEEYPEFKLTKIKEEQRLIQDALKVPPNQRQDHR